eukprot:TRINITY_DN5271_c1_g1_i1.p4 TRINITY_DN5271_c1_g1~~TRINITY_DN5271_c1_g1_i1.p4  ORF type:complete len:102 (-),score=8.91 TRINITY_DN5271_c1_g1_i1:108-413(-)
MMLMTRRDVVAVDAGCSRLRRLAFSDTIWRSLYETDFPRGRTSSGGLRWCDVYGRAMRYNSGAQDQRLRAAAYAHLRRQSAGGSPCFRLRSTAATLMRRHR